MKASRILLFIVSVIALLGVLCSFFPRDGVNVGPVGLEFPSVGEMLVGAAEEEDSESPEELLARRMQAIREAQQNEYLKYFETDPARFHFPGGDVTLFDKLFSELDAAMEKPMRIVHYGDSQIEEDRVTSTIRAFFQKRFGGGGPGLVPVQKKYFSYSIGESSSTTPRKFIVYGPSEMRAGVNTYGPAGRIDRIDSVTAVTFYPVKSNEAPSRYFNRLTVLSGNLRSPLSVSMGKDKRSIEAGSNINRTVFNLADSTTRTTVTLAGHADIYGIMLDCDKGVSMDNVAMRGCSGSIFTSINAEQLRDYYRQGNVRLIILQYGGNTVPYLKTDKGISEYKGKIVKQINYLKGLAPEATFIFIGPSDMSTNIQGRMQTYPKLPAIVDSLKSAANEAGAVFWDMYSAMGGENSMPKWVKASPSLAGGDYVHFTPRGAENMGNMFCESMMLYYEYYKWRKENEE